MLFPCYAITGYLPVFCVVSITIRFVRLSAYEKCRGAVYSDYLPEKSEGFYFRSVKFTQVEA